MTVDAWTLKCLYNRSDYPQRIESGEFVSLYEKSSKPRANGERTVQVYYGRPTDRFLMVRLQWFENAEGEILRSGLKEPKHMCLDGIDYHMHGGDTCWQQFRRDPTNVIPRTANNFVICMKKQYGKWRRYKCNRFGPVEAYWRSWWFTSGFYGGYRDSADSVVRRYRRARKALKPYRSAVRRFFSEPRGPVLALS